VGKLQVLCGTISIAPATCEVAISAGTTLPLRGTTSDQPPVTEVCPANQMVVAIRSQSGLLLDQLAAGCAPLTLSPAGSAYQATVGPITWLMPVGGTGGSAYSDTCPANQIASGAFIRSGVWIDAIALVCSTPALAP
jgi:hypothetical protein